MSLLLECIEPQSRPARRHLAVSPGDEVVIYAIPLPPNAPHALRRSVMRRASDPPPPDAVRVVGLRVETTALLVTDVGRKVVVDMLRGELRSQVVAGIRIPNTAIYEITLPDRGRLNVSFVMHAEVERGASVGVSGSGSRTSRVRYGTDNIWWLITDSKGILVTVGIDAWDRFRDRLIGMGIDGRVLVFLGGMILTAGGTWYAYSVTSEANERADDAENALEMAQAAQAASLATELACLEQRKGLVETLGDENEQRRLAAEMALTLPLASTASIEIGGPRMANADVLALDELYRPNLVQAVVSRMEQAEGDPVPCLQQKPALGKDLPTYLLTWHPDPGLTCPLDYVTEEAGVRRMGRWGLSNRVAREFGTAGTSNTGTTPETLDELLGDPRREDRWSAFTMAMGYRGVLDAILRTRRTARPPTLPSQSHLWALALLDAYNRMPSIASGALDMSAAACVENLLAHRLDAASPAVPGEPLLPDIASVAGGDVKLVATPAPGCPWPRDAMVVSTDAALRAAARLADTELLDDGP